MPVYVKTECGECEAVDEFEYDHVVIIGTGNKPTGEIGTRVQIHHVTAEILGEYIMVLGHEYHRLLKEEGSQQGEEEPGNQT